MVNFRFEKVLMFAVKSCLNYTYSHCINSMSIQATVKNTQMSLQSYAFKASLILTGNALLTNIEYKALN